MKSNNKNGRHLVEDQPNQKRLKTKPVLIILFLLLLGNSLWFIAWLIPNESSGSGEEVASVEGQGITREDWIVAMEEQYGKDTLLELVNAKVMESAAGKYKIKVTDKEIDLELALIRSAQDSTVTQNHSLNKDMLRPKMRAQLILEKVLTKDVIIEDVEIQTFYDENKSLYNIPTTYQASLIVLQSESEAQEVVEELENGSSFDVLARERSVDIASASLGGNIGFISEGQENVDSSVVTAVSKLEIEQWSSPVLLTDERYAVVYLQDIAQGKAFSYKDMKGHIKRELALEQLPQSVSPEAFWKEFDTQWFYSE
ncbi:peptidyl-prolyl cis-trans isomerase [Paenisporosarcina antarctica]|uniref:peptidylprolyl isomerase n=1 Tax=Paenisporosarcina antarctica TaxID=417367 RepID=A0A4P7A285_9BACL|nr:peptidyl-prolyl cis-trans isomerase [Paenisporosarcina antarctica]QBP42992.1 foldase [Paenisporosarcina antarctica]